MNRVVLMSSAEHFRVDDAINPYYGDTLLSTEAAIREHETIAATLGRLGIRVIRTLPPEGSQDGAYTAN